MGAQRVVDELAEKDLKRLASGLGERIQFLESVLAIIKQRLEIWQEVD